MSLWLVTGGAGFIGSHLVDGLVAEDHSVRVLDNLDTGSAANLAHVRERIEFCEGSLLDEARLTKAMADVEVVFHFAGPASIGRSIAEPVSTHESSATGTLRLLMAARDARVRRVIFASSASVYGEGSRLPLDETGPTQPTTPHGVAALMGEHYCMTFTQLYGLETVRLRCFNVFGPRQIADTEDPAVIPALLQSMLAGQRPVIRGDGCQTRDFIDVADVVQASQLAATARRVSGRVYNIASGRQTSLLGLVERINAILGTDLRPIHTAPRLGDTRHS